MGSSPTRGTWYNLVNMAKISERLIQRYVRDAKKIPEAKVVTTEGGHVYTLIDDPIRDTFSGDPSTPRGLVYGLEPVALRSVKRGQRAPNFHLTNLADYSDPDTVYIKYTGVGVRVLLNRWKTELD